MLEANGITVIGQSLIDCTAVSFDGIPAADWVFFYSKNGIRFFLEGLGEMLSSKIRLATMGKGTAATLEANGYQAHFIGTGEPIATAIAFNKIAAQQRVLFPRAEVSKKSVQQLLLPTIHQIDLVVYRNQAKKKVELPHCQYLAFTSPLNAQTYFGKKNYQKGQIIFSIGATTEKELNKMGFFKIIVAKNPSERALAEAVLEYLV